MAISIREMFVCVGMALAFAGCNRSDPVQRLAKVRLPARPIEARLTGGFAWAPVGTPTRGSSGDASDLVRAAAATLPPRRTPADDHADALVRILTNHASEATTTLAAMAAGSRRAALWSDLAAARYTAAVSAGRDGLLVEALIDVDRALRLEPDLAEALFNRAVILERFGLRDSAIAAWERFLAVDATSGWAVEARSRLQSLTAPRPEFRPLFDRDSPILATDHGALTRLMTAFRQDARVAAETEVLPRWADATLAGDHAGATRHLDVAAAIGAELARTGGEAIIGREVAIIRGAGDTQRIALARGHAQFRDAQKVFRSGRPGEAEPMFRQAAATFSSAGSSFAILARFFIFYAQYEQGDVAQSTRGLQGVLAEVSPEFATVQARVRWQLAICRGAAGQWGEVIEYSASAVEDFERAGEKYYAAVVREHVAEGFELIGDLPEAWAHRIPALREIGPTSNRFLHAILGFMTQHAIMRGEWDLAASLANIEEEVARKSRFQPVIADSHLRRARIDHHFGQRDPANELARARITIASIPDAGIRARLEARLVAVEAMVAPTPARATELLSQAIGFHQSPNGQRMFVPTLLLHRARAHRSMGSKGEARRDLDAALAKLDDGRHTLKASEQRTGIFEPAEAILDEALDLALEQRDVPGALAYAERARARSLLDALRERGGSRDAIALPRGTAVIEYAFTPSRAAVFVSDHSSVRVATFPIARADVARRVTEFASALSAGDSSATALGRTLYRDLLQPIEPWLSEYDTLVTVADASTAALPFAALPVPSGGFFVEKHLLLSAPSLAVYKEIASRPAPEPAGTVLMVVNSAAGAEGLQPLGATSKEARRIQSLYRDVRVLIDAQATRRAFFSEAPRAQRIHFAGHALSSEYRPEETSLVLAGADGRVHAGEIAAMRLHRCSTVVLSACSTARGTLRRFEGNLSVARAFLAAGVPSVVATLWPIDDRDAAEFFPLIHQQLVQGRTAAEAVREAQLQFIRSSRPSSMWAAVHVTGN